jgi:hypothetical protein
VLLFRMLMLLHPILLEPSQLHLYL